MQKNNNSAFFVLKKHSLSCLNLFSLYFFILLLIYLAYWLSVKSFVNHDFNSSLECEHSNCLRKSKGCGVDTNLQERVKYSYSFRPVELLYLTRPSENCLPGISWRMPEICSGDQKPAATCRAPAEISTRDEAGESSGV